MQMFGPLLEFHKAAEHANGDDVRMHWDVRLVRGKDEFLFKVEGSSTLPGLISPTNLQHSSHTITTEVFEKIAKPLADLLQNRINDKALDEAPALPGVAARITHTPDEKAVDLSQDASDPTEGLRGQFDQKPGEDDIDEGTELRDDVDES